MENKAKDGKKNEEILLSQDAREKLENFEKEQENFKNNLSNKDVPLVHDIMYIGGLNILYDYKDKNVGISGLIVIDYKSLEIVYEDYNLIKIDEPYIPSFLSFRELSHYAKLIEDLKIKAPHFIPQIFLLNRTGIFHPEGFGIACHLGVLKDIAIIGCTKTVFSVDGITKEQVKEMAKEELKKKGDSFKLIGFSGNHWGYALKYSNNEDKPLIISIGNKISNETSLKIIKKMCKISIPEPIRIVNLLIKRLIIARNKYGRNNNHNILNWNLKDYLEQKKEYLHRYLNQSYDEKVNNELNIGEKNIQESSRGIRVKGRRRGGKGNGSGKHNRRINLNQNFIKNEEKKNKDNEKNNLLIEKFSERRNKEKIDKIIPIIIGPCFLGKSSILKILMKDGFLNENNY